MHLDLTASGTDGAAVVHRLKQQVNHLKAQDDHDPDRIAIAEAAVREVERAIGEADGSATARITVVIQTAAQRKANRAAPRPVHTPAVSAEETPSHEHDYPPKHVPDLRRSSVHEGLEQQIADVDTEIAAVQSDTALSDTDRAAKLEELTGRKLDLEDQLDAASTPAPTSPQDLAPIGG